jgi:hypothetical protein
MEPQTPQTPTGGDRTQPGQDSPPEPTAGTALSDAPPYWNPSAASAPQAYGWVPPYSPWPAQRPRPAPESVYRPGVWFYLISIAVVVVGLVSASLPSPAVDGYIWLAGAVLAFVWFIAFIIAANDTRLAISSRAWARWAGIPALGILFVAVASSGVPTAVRFELSRSNLDAAAVSARAGHPQAPGWIGLMPVDNISVYPDGVVTFEVSGTSGCGLANFSGDWPDDSSDAGEGYPMTRLSSNWWTWCGYGSFD